NAPVVALQAWVRTGAMNEGKWMGAGLSHFCEHLLFKGTPQRPAGVLDQVIRGAGGDDNAYTTSERTVYHITGAANGFDVAFSALADMVMNAAFPPDETVKEHAVVMKEIERHLDSPDDMLWEAFERTIYQEHPYRVPVLGYPDRFQSVTRDEVFAYYQERYAPEMTTFIAVGDFEAPKILPAMARTLAVWKRKSVAPVTVPPEPEQVAPRFVQVSHPLCEVPKLVLAFPAVSQRHPDLYALDLLASILGDGRSSRLYRSVKDELDAVLEVSASNYTPLYPGYFTVTATTEPDKLERARAGILAVLEEARSKKPGSEELARAKRKVYTQHIFQQMTADGQAGDLGSGWLVAGDLDFAEHYTERIQQVSAEEVLRAAKQYLVPEKLTTAILIPKPKPEKEQATERGAGQSAGSPYDEQRRLETEAQKLLAEPAITKGSFLVSKAVFEFALKSNGLRVVVREDHTLPVVNIVLAALGGLRWEPADLAGEANMLAEMLDRGTTKRSKLKIATETEGLGASLSTFSGRDSFGVTISGLKQDSGKLMDLAADCMLHSGSPSDELERLRTDVLQQIAQEDESLFVLNSKILRPLLFGSHPYARQLLGTPDTVRKVAQQDLKALHRALVQPENMAVSLVGDITALEALALTRQYLGELKPGGFRAPAVSPMPELAGSKKGQGEKEKITGAILTLGFRGTDIKGADRETLELMAALLSGLGGRLYVSLREKQGLAYDVGVYNESHLDGGDFVFYIQTDAQSLDKALDGMWKEIQKLRAEPAPQNELNSIKNYLAGMEAISLQNQGELAQRLALAELYNEGAAHVFDRKARVEKITAEALKAAAAKYLDEKTWAQAVLKPAPNPKAETPGTK
ncbi:MAG: pitrilysin family protein, partial [Planctomycetota bacterium]|nr:pitrilysin family protein [Planctomycetota bacterium]